jgi:Ca2+/Na+ antiporter
MTFDRSSKMYTAILLGITTLVSIFLLAFGVVKGVAGPFLMFLFTLYIGSIAYAIYRGVMSAPEDSDSDSDSDSAASDSSESDPETEEWDINSDATLHATHESVVLKQVTPEAPGIKLHREKGDDSPQGKKLKKFRQKPLKPVVNKRPKSLYYHINRLLMGFVALSVSCYVLSHSIASVGDDLGLSGTLVGITILSLATTLPEKFIAILGGSKGQGGIVVANTVGSNIFLLTLCAGTLFIFGDSSVLETGVHVAEIGVMWLSSVALAVCVFCGADRRVGIVMLVLYAVFMVAEFTVFRSGEGPSELVDDLFRRLV